LAHSQDQGEPEGENEKEEKGEMSGTVEKPNKPKKLEVRKDN
jgi:hypothetical protein